MWYYKIPRGSTGKRTATRLLALKDHFASNEGVPPRRDDTLLLATWNIREFDSPAYGKRGLESLYYIAEIISHFDLVAIQEVREDLDALEEVKDLLGFQWNYIATDVTEGTRGNRERMAFLFDARKVRFGNIAGEVVIPPIEKRVPGGRKLVFEPSKQLYRTPFLSGFEAGWSRFMLCTVHILYGRNIKDDTNRVEEIRRTARFLMSRAKEKSSWSGNIILLGDFNIFDPDDVTMQQITDAGFIVPEELKSIKGTTVGRQKRYYDQIAFFSHRNERTKRFGSTGRAGVFDYYKTVYTSDDEKIYVKEMGKRYHKTSKGVLRDEARKKNYYRTYWRTHQMSDHLPMWIELKIDFGREYLMRKAR